MLQRIATAHFAHFAPNRSFNIICVLFVFSLQEDHAVMSFTINSTGQLALLNVATQVCEKHCQYFMRLGYGTRYIGALIPLR